MRFEIDRSGNTQLGADPQIDGAIRGDDGRWYIDISDLGALIALMRRLGKPLILDISGEQSALATRGEEEYSIEVYDYFRE